MAKAKSVSLHNHLFFDRLLLISLVLGAGGYIFQGTLSGVILEVGALFGGIIWSYRTATNYPNRGIRIGASILFVLLALIVIVYIAGNQGLISNDSVNGFRHLI